jgi:plastocyanin
LIQRLLAVVATSIFAAATFGNASAATVAGAAHGAQVVWISDGVTTPAGETDVTNQDRTFIPPLTVISAGSSVRFPNNDPFYHSIYSVSPADPFDIGYYGNGPGKVVAFANAGVVDVHCHIHPSMHGVIVVVDGHSQLPSNDNFSIVGVPAGNWVFHTWSLDAGEHTQRVNVPKGQGTVTLR